VTDPKPTTNQTKKLRTLLTYYAQQGRSISEMPALCGRSVKTLKGHARLANLSFQDYTPRTPRGE